MFGSAALCQPQPPALILTAEFVRQHTKCSHEMITLTKAGSDPATETGPPSHSERKEKLSSTPRRASRLHIPLDAHRKRKKQEDVCDIKKY